MPCTDSSERIAIVGVGGIFPGALDLATFWSNISAGIDAGRQVPADRWYLPPEKAYAPWPPQPDRVYSTWGCFVEGFQFDSEGLDIPGELLSRLDPMFHLGLHAAHAAYRDARGLAGVDHARVGVILGNIALPTESTSAICRDVLGRTFIERLIDTAAAACRANLPSDHQGDHDPVRDSWSTALADPATAAALKAGLRRSDWHPLNRFAAGLPSSLIAQGLGLGGLAFTLDAACASSLYSLKFAAEELLSHRADAMLAGGMSRPDCQYTQMGFAQLQALSRRGRCAPLSAEADGLVVGEGAGVFVLKRLRDAVAHGDQIYGVIAGIGLSNDRGANLLAPHSEGQLRAMRSAYTQAGWRPSDVDLIECHATGTPVGDGVEISSLHQLWEHEDSRPRQCVIGGVKSNVGHLLTGAGAAGLMKVLLALRHRTLPPTANFKGPAEGLAADDSPFRVLSRAEPWESRCDQATVSQLPIPRRATINAFGFGGINAHVLIEEWPGADRANSPSTTHQGPDAGESTRSASVVDEPNDPTMSEVATDSDSTKTPIAIVGIDVHAGAWDSKDAFQTNYFQGRSPQATEPSGCGVEQSDWLRRERTLDETGQSASEHDSRFAGGITEVRLPMGRFRIPPREMQDMLVQQQLMLKVAAGAIKDAALPSQQPPSAAQTTSAEPPASVDQTSSATEASDVQHGINTHAADLDELSNRTGVFIGIELDPNTTNFHFRWSVEQDADHWARVLGLSLDADQLADWIRQLKDAAGPPLTPNRVMGNLGGIVASRLAREFDVGGPSFTVSGGGRSDLVALELAVRALQRGELDRAIVGGVLISSDPRWRVPSHQHSAAQELEHAATHDVTAVADGDFIEGNVANFAGEGCQHSDLSEAIVLKRLSDVDPASERCYATIHQTTNGRIENDAKFLGVGRSQFPLTGGTRIAGNLAAPILEIYQRLDRSRKDSGFEGPESDWRGGRLAPFNADPQFGEMRRRLPQIRAVTEVSLELCESASPQTAFIAAERRRPIGELPLGLFVIDGDSFDELISKLDELSVIAGRPRTIEQLAVLWFQKHPPSAQRRWVLTLVPASPAALSVAIARGRERLIADRSVADRSFAERPIAEGLVRDVNFTPLPLAGRVAFVFPGSGNAFRHMGRALLSVFPDVLRRQSRENSDLSRQLALNNIWYTAGMRHIDHKSMIFSQVAMGAAVCDLLAMFGVQPSASVGYSLGESAALFGLRAWMDRDEMLQRMRQSPLFGSDLVAPFDAAQKAWHVPDGQEVPWLAGIIDRPAADVRAAIERCRQGAVAPRLHLLIVNTPRQCVIGGERKDVERLVAELKAKFIPLGSPSTVHCDILRQVEPAYRELHLMRTTAPLVQTPSGARPIDFYSAATGRTYAVTRESAAEAIVAQAVQTIDFPQVIERAYADGVRIFVEIGPGSSCTRMIDEILGDRPHFARSALPVTSRPVESFLELIAALIAERVPVDLGYLYGDATPLPDVPQSELRHVVTRVGGLPFEIPTPPEGWRFRGDRSSTSDCSATMDRMQRSSWTAVPFSSSRSNGDQATASDVVVTLPRVPSSIDDSSLERPAEASEVVDYSPTTATFIPISSAAGIESPLNLWDQFQLMTDQRTQTHETFLRLSAHYEHLAAEQLALLARAGRRPAAHAGSPLETDDSMASPPDVTSWPTTADVRAAAVPVASEIAIPVEPPRSLDRRQCLEFAIGEIGRVLGQKFAPIDSHPTRVRLPDEPLMLVDRIVTIEGEPLSMTSGRVVTEHDIHPGMWYLDCGRIPTCIAVESGQADLFLSGWLGIDFETKGLASYRLLDAVVTFHDALPQAGKTIRYDIRVLHFFRQGSTFLFRFEFDATVDGRPLLTMREGCAGFFTDAELAGGKGIVHTALDRRPRPGTRPADWNDPIPMTVESYDDRQLLALRRGDLAACFGPAFAGLPITNPVTLPGLIGSVGSSHPDEVSGSDQAVRGRMWLVDRVLKLDPVGGKFGLGTILGELDIHPDDWFLTCHFCDDQVMPGTLMYECCLHTLRIYLLRLGWIGETAEIVYEPIPEIRSRLKCRGQVLAGTKKVWYEVTLKEVGYGSHGTDRTDAADGARSADDDLAAGDNGDLAPYCLADALMYADGKPIVEITDMSVRLTGLTKREVEQLWRVRRSPAAERISSPIAVVPSITAIMPTYDRRPALFDTERITAFAIGKPSDAFGDRYLPFDAARKIARLPGPPFQFLDRIVSIENCQPWVLQAGGEIVAQYDAPWDAWYFASNRQPTMPFAVLLETALQPCGWLAAYLGSALTSDVDLSFRNLGGIATQYQAVTPQSGTLTTTVKMTRVSNSAGMIIQHYDFDLRCDGEPVYVGNTYFGFFSKAALSHQIGIRDAAPYQPTPQETTVAQRGLYPADAPFPDERFRMIQTIESLVPHGGPHGRGCVVGTMTVDPTSWFFKAHFHEDPVVPGSLGLESFWQLVKVYAAQRWNPGSNARFSTPTMHRDPATGVPLKHEWVYRGQVLPSDRLVTVTMVVRDVDDVRHTVTAEGFLSVDGRVIYQMKNFVLDCG